MLAVLTALRSYGRGLCFPLSARWAPVRTGMVMRCCPPPFIVSRSLSHWMQNGCLAVALSVERNDLNRSVAADQLAGQLIVAL